MNISVHAEADLNTVAHADLANAVRFLAVDAIETSQSGHPGLPMGMADVATVLFSRFLKFDAAHPGWPDRDRFVLSAGHGSMLLYALLYLTGGSVSLDDIKAFRQWGSKTPGHPEYGHPPGVETTTGPLGQGIATAVGMAIAEKMLAGQFNRDTHKIVDHYTYVFMGEGCMMEGISRGAGARAGARGRGKLIAFWDDNGISIDGHVEGWFTDDTPKRFEAYGWHVVRNVDGHDGEAVKKAIQEARAVNDKPTLICTKTVIGYGAPNLCGSHDCHGAPLGNDEITATRENLGWSHEAFMVPDEIYAGWSARDKGAKAEAAWAEKFAKYKAAYPDLAAEFERRVIMGELPKDWANKAKDFVAACNSKAEKLAIRKAL